MKKILLVLFAFALSLSLVFAFTACGGDGDNSSGGGGCRHRVVVDAAVEPTCTESGLTEGEHCSRCDEVFQAQQTVPALGHKDADDDTFCDACNKELVSAGLKFTLLSDNTYSVSRGICTDKDIYIPSEYNELPVSSIASDAFHGCDSLTSITIPDSVTSIGYRAFWHCSSLTSVNFGDNSQLKSIGDDAFEYCSSLTSITIPNSVTSIGFYASPFANCYRLVEVINKSSLNITKGSDRNGYVAYYALEVHTGESKIVNINDYLFYTVDGVNYLVNYIGNETNLTLPESYNGENYVIKSCAFYDYDNIKNITSVTIPDSVTSIGGTAFSYCSNLTSITIPNSVTSIGYGAFFYCSNLTSITIPNSVTSIGDYAFNHCDELTDVYYTGSVEEWVQISMGSSYNEKLTSLPIHFNSKG